MSLVQRLGNHNRSWIWGRHVVLETLRVGKWRPLELLISPRCADEVRVKVEDLAKRLRLTLEMVTDAQLEQRCRAEDHQGLAANLPDFPYASFASLLQRQPTITSWLVLDGIQDSFNLGAIVRSAVELGIEAILIGTVGQSAINSQATRSSAGAVNHVPIARVEHLPSAVDQLRKQGVRLIAASEKASSLIHEIDLTSATALVIGNEGTGISQDIWKRCDLHARIPTSDLVGSLNAAVAAGILCYEVARQRLRDQPQPSRGL